MGWLRHRITYANVVSTLALVIALGGGAVYAANKIGAQGIRKGAIRSYHIKNRQVRRQDIAGGAISTRQVSNDSLTGKDIKEATLGLVPSALDARTVNGITERLVRASQPNPSGAAQVVAQGGLTALLSCSGGGATLQIHGSAAGDVGSVFHGEGDSDSTEQFSAGSSASFTSGASTAGFATVRRLDGTVTRLDFELRWQPGAFGADTCFLHGFLLTGR